MMMIDNILRRIPARGLVWGMVGAALVVAGCSDDSTVAPPPAPQNQVNKFNADVPVAWFDFQMKLIEKTPGFSPPVASRALGYSGVALYEAIVGGTGSEYQSLAGQLNSLTSVPQPESGKEYHWPVVANSALASITKSLYGNATADYVAKMDSIETALNALYKSSVATEVFDRSVKHGKAVAEAIFNWSKTDGGHEGYSKNFPADYQPPTGPGMWVPTPRPGGLPPQSALQPYWGKNRPFVLPVGNVTRDCDPGPPPAYSTDPNSRFYQEGLEVYNSVKNLNDEQRNIALFWADDAGKTCTPPGHSVSILSQCLKQMNWKLDRAAEAYARMGIAVADAFIACWEVKYKYNLLRPISYIQLAIDTNWNRPAVTDPLGTPPFPEYPSGHSVQSGAAAAVLTGLMGSPFLFTDHTHDAAGRTSRSFASFDAFAAEAAISRLYGGIHYRSAIENGVTQGKKIGAAVNALKFKK